MCVCECMWGEGETTLLTAHFFLENKMNVRVWIM